MNVFIYDLVYDPNPAIRPKTEIQHSYMFVSFIEMKEGGILSVILIFSSFIWIDVIVKV